MLLASLVTLVMSNKFTMVPIQLTIQYSCINNSVSLSKQKFPKN